MQNAAEIIQRTMMPVLAGISRSSEMKNARIAESQRNTSNMIGQMGDTMSFAIQRYGEKKKKEKEDAYLNDFLNTLSSDETIPDLAMSDDFGGPGDTGEKAREKARAKASPQDKMFAVLGALDEKYGPTDFGRNIRRSVVQNQVGKTVGGKKYDSMPWYMSPEVDPSTRTAMLTHDSVPRVTTPKTQEELDRIRSQTALNQSQIAVNQGKVLSGAAKAVTDPITGVIKFFSGGLKGKGGSTKTPEQIAADLEYKKAQTGKVVADTKVSEAKLKPKMEDAQKKADKEMATLQKNLNTYTKMSESESLTDSEKAGYAKKAKAVLNRINKLNGIVDVDAVGNAFKTSVESQMQETRTGGKGVFVDDEVYGKQAYTQGRQAFIRQMTDEGVFDEAQAAQKFDDLWDAKYNEEAGQSWQKYEDRRNIDKIREDGTQKGKGFLGELATPSGKKATEISIGVRIDGKETLIPTLVPTLTQEEIDYLVQGGKVTKPIVQKAVAHARQRMAEGKSPFAGPGEQVNESIEKKTAPPALIDKKAPPTRAEFVQSSVGKQFVSQFGDPAELEAAMNLLVKNGKIR
jgi:hypothetical protein